MTRQPLRIVVQLRFEVATLRFLDQAMRQHEHAFGAGHALLAPALIEMGDTALTERLLLVNREEVMMQGVLRVHIERQHRQAGPLQRRGQVGRQGALADPALGGDHRQNADVIELGRRGNGHHRLLDRRAGLLPQLG